MWNTSQLIWASHYHVKTLGQNVRKAECFFSECLQCYNFVYVHPEMTCTFQINTNLLGLISFFSALGILIYIIRHRVLLAGSSTFFFASKWAEAWNLSTATNSMSTWKGTTTTATATATVITRQMWAFPIAGIRFIPTLLRSSSECTPEVPH